uniref:Uncharacterized protein n=1 Tax=Medicago truncatula TaxID=3880 RepID=A2Q3H9_MEDTR|nr:hypothetical protein MtrDRAFT_AC155882g40v2 [Medicago truncatula]ABN09004.1 hypothetical protein MtrDRAFT_AC172101g6v1 [Medicago truncatula]
MEDSRLARLLYQQSWAAQMRVSVTDIRARIHHSVAAACQRCWAACQPSIKWRATT